LFDRYEARSGDAEDRAAIAFAQARDNLFPLRDRLRPQESYPAGGLANVGARGEILIRGSHTVGGKRECGCQFEGFVGSQMRHG